GQALAQARRRPTGVAVFFLDLDGFKGINDALGHEAGDAVLRETAQRLVRCVREGDTVARLGGDGFTVILPEVASEGEVLAVGRRIVDTLARPIGYGERTLQVTTSLGIALASEDGEEVDTLLKKADLAMYVAKEGGKNRYTMYEPTMRPQEPAPT